MSMTDWWTGFWSGLASGGVLVGFTTAITWLWSHFRSRRPLNRLLDPFAKKGEHCVIVLPKLPLQLDKEYPFEKEIRGKKTPLHRTGDLMTTYDSIAVSWIHAILSLAGKKVEEVEVKQDEAFGEGELNVNLICIGAWSNRITMAAIEKSPYFKFGEDGKGGYISSQKIGKCYYDYENHRSYGILLKLRNVFQNKAAILVAGLSPDATTAAAYYLWSNREDLAKKYSTSSFGILVKIDTDLGYSSAEPIEEWSPRE